MKRLDADGLCGFIPKEPQAVIVTRFSCLCFRHDFRWHFGSGVFFGSKVDIEMGRKLIPLGGWPDLKGEMRRPRKTNADMPVDFSWIVMNQSLKSMNKRFQNG